MKFLHMADMHFDAPFSTLANNGLGDLRRLEQRNALRKIINYIKENEIEYLFIAGDLYDQKDVRKSTIEFINNEFAKIPNTKIFIVPGNHDPYIKDSYYEKFDFCKNVYIFNKKIDVYEDENIRIYGVGFTDFYMNDNPLKDIEVVKDLKTTVLISHCDINGAKDKDGLSYNPILLSRLRELDFDYAALGHIHNIEFEENEKITYSGSTISMGFDELGEHGVIVGELKNGKLSTEFLKIDDRIFTEYELNVENCGSNEEIIELINDLKFDEKELVKIILIGIKNFDIDVIKITGLITNQNIIKIKDKTTINIDVEKIIKENSLKGLFIREVIEKYNNNEIDEEEVQTIIQIGIDAM
ncbi:MAG: exonuclease SbcCD subunit D [Candidatus Scatovivens sp.]